jgi:micrococcal nuclease
MSKPFTYRISKDTINVYDGDTFKCDIDLGFSIILKKQAIRLSGINCPELRTKDKREKALGYEAKEKLIEILDEAYEITLQSLGKGKFGRVISIIYADGYNVNDMMVESGLARAYDGGKRSSWFSTNVL